MHRVSSAPFAVFLLATSAAMNAFGGSVLEDCVAWPDGCHPGSSTSPRPAVPVAAPPFASGLPIRPARTYYGVEAGAGAFARSTPLDFNRGVGAVTSGGVVWGLRAGISLRPWLMLEGRYFGMDNPVESAGAEAVHMVTHAGIGLLRLALPLRTVQPYVFAGLGYYATVLSGPESSRQVSGIRRTAALGIPAGVGAEIRLDAFFALGIEATWHLLMFPNYSTRREFNDGEPVTATLFVRVRL